jgi:hypothetical protein
MCDDHVAYSVNLVDPVPYSTVDAAFLTRRAILFLIPLYPAAVLYERAVLIVASWLLSQLFEVFLEGNSILLNLVETT